MKKAIKLRHGLITMGAVIAIMFVSIVIFEASPHVPLVFSCFVAGLMAIWLGFSWDEILDGAVANITNCLEAVLILLLIGMLAGSWIASGTISSMIYYGLKLVTAKNFLPVAMILCSIVSLAIGSWGTVGTLGVALMGMGVALDIPAPLVAGVIISGSYCGESISPLSDVTNFSAAIVNEDLGKIIKKMVIPVAVSFAIALVGYTVVGFRYSHGDNSLVEKNIEELLGTLSGNFNISLILLIPLVVVMGCILAKVPAIPSMIIGIFCGMIFAVVFQGFTPNEMLVYSYSGFVSDTGNAIVDDLLTNGGIVTMFSTITLVILAMALGGILQRTGLIQVTVSSLMARAKSHLFLRLTTILTCIGFNTIVPDQYLGVSFPGQMYGEEFEKRNIRREDLAATLLCGAVTTSPLIAWNTCGLYCFAILGISPMKYGAFAFYCLALPIVGLLTVKYGERDAK